MIFVVNKIIGDPTQRDYNMGVWKAGIRWKINNGFSLLRLLETHMCVIAFDLTSNVIFGLSNDSSRDGGKFVWAFYKRTIGGCSVCFILTSYSVSQYTKLKGALAVLDIMTQGQLLGNSGVGKIRERMCKRLKISVPHFDNSALIKTFSKTLTGSCMNSEEQDMKALIGNLLKFWKLEVRVTGTHLGLGKLQYDFDKEDDIDAVMKLQPFHFDYWMLSLARWQSKRAQSFPSDITF